VIYGKLTIHDRQIDKVHIEITRKGLVHACPNDGVLQWLLVSRFNIFCKREKVGQNL